MSRSFRYEDDESRDATEDEATEEDSGEESEDATEVEDSDEESGNATENEDSDEEGGDATEEDSGEESEDAKEEEEESDEESGDASRSSYFRVITKPNWGDHGEGTDSENDEGFTPGANETVFVNFIDLCDTMDREPDHVRDFLRSKLRTNAVEKEEGLVVFDRLAPEDIERILQQFIDEYVVCHECESLETILSEDAKKNFVVRCEKCGYEESVAPIHYVKPRRLGRTGTPSQYN